MANMTIENFQCNMTGRILLSHPTVRARGRSVLSKVMMFLIVRNRLNFPTNFCYS